MARGNAGNLLVGFGLDNAQWAKDINKSIKAGDKFTRKMQKDFNSLNLKKAAIGVVAFTAALTAVSLKLTKIASDAEEINSKFSVVFRTLDKEASGWAVNFGKEVGRAKQDIKKWMAGLQDTFVPLGFAREKAFDLSKSLTALAVDVASFNNAADEEVIRDFTSALVGNHETVRKYGIIISENTIKQASFASGLNKTYKQLTDRNL